VTRRGAAAAATTVVAVALAWPARAGEGSKVWDAQFDARLVQALDGTSDVAAQLLDESLDDLGADDPQRGEILFWLGRARWESGDGDAAVSLLQESARDPATATRARTMLAQIELIRHQVTRVPLNCGFDHDTCGLQRAWEDAEKGGIERQDVGDGQALAWDTTITSAGSDHLLLAIAPDQRVTRIGLRVRSSQVSADLRLNVMDGTGGRWSSQMYRVSTDEWLTIEVPVARFTRATPVPFDSTPPRVRVLDIEDLTGMLSTERGPNTLLLDDLTLE